MRSRDRVKTYMLILGLAMLLALLAGCGGSTSDLAVDPGGNLSGTITVSGAFALYPMMVNWGDAFQTLHPDVQFDISAGGAGKGMADTLANAVDIGMVSRAIYPEEVEKGAFGVAVVKDAVFVTINAQNPVWADLHQRGMTRETFAGIYITGEITTWGQAAGRPEVTDPIHVYTRSDACGAADTWALYLGKKQEDLAGVAVYGDPGLLDTVIKDPLAMGYNNLNYAYDVSTGAPVAGALVVPIDVNGNGQADPEELYDSKEDAIGAVATGQYPSPPARDLYLVANGKPSGLVAEFIRWVLTDGQNLIGEAGYIALSQDKLDQELHNLD